MCGDTPDDSRDPPFLILPCRLAVALLKRQQTLLKKYVEEIAELREELARAKVRKNTSNLLVGRA